MRRTHCLAYAVNTPIEWLVRPGDRPARLTLPTGSDGITDKRRTAAARSQPSMKEIIMVVAGVGFEPSAGDWTAGGSPQSRA